MLEIELTNQESETNSLLIIQLLISVIINIHFFNTNFFRLAD